MCSFNRPNFSFLLMASMPYGMSWRQTPQQRKEVYGRLVQRTQGFLMMASTFAFIHKRASPWGPANRLSLSYESKLWGSHHDQTHIFLNERKRKRIMMEASACPYGPTNGRHHTFSLFHLQENWIRLIVQEMLIRKKKA